MRMSFIARYVYTYDEFVFMTEASTVQQNDSDRTKTLFGGWTKGFLNDINNSVTH